MTIINKSGGRVVFLGESHDSYRVVNQSLRALGLTVIWSAEVEATTFLVETSNVDIVLCDAQVISDAHREMLDGLNALPGMPAGLALTLPTLSSNPDDLEQNMYAYKRLLRAVTSLLCNRQAREQDALETAA